MRTVAAQMPSATILRAAQAGVIAAKEFTLGLKTVSSSGQKKHTL